MKRENFPPAHGVPMEVLTERALHAAFLDVVEESRREGFPVVIDRDGIVAEVMPENLASEVRFARNRIAELSAEITKYQHPFSLNKMPDERGTDL
jgi:hypothetical protein